MPCCGCAPTWPGPAGWSGTGCPPGCNGCGIGGAAPAPAPASGEGGGEGAGPDAGRCPPSPSAAANCCACWMACIPLCPTSHARPAADITASNERLFDVLLGCDVPPGVVGDGRVCGRVPGPPRRVVAPGAAADEPVRDVVEPGRADVGPAGRVAVARGLTDGRELAAVLVVLTGRRALPLDDVDVLAGDPASKNSLSNWENLI